MSTLSLPGKIKEYCPLRRFNIAMQNKIFKYLQWVNNIYTYVHINGPFFHSHVKFQQGTRNSTWLFRRRERHLGWTYFLVLENDWCPTSGFCVATPLLYSYTKSSAALHVAVLHEEITELIRPRSWNHCRLAWGLPLLSEGLTPSWLTRPPNSAPTASEVRLFHDCGQRRLEAFEKDPWLQDFVAGSMTGASYMRTSNKLWLAQINQ